MIAIGVDPKLVRMIKILYEDTKCAVVMKGQITDWFAVKIGVSRGCLLSPTLFNIFLEIVIKELKSLNPSLQMRDSFSVDIRYADDTTLLSTNFEKLRLSTEELENACKKLGMNISGAKCKIISPSKESIVIYGQEVEHVDDFVFLGSVVRSSEADVKRRTALASSAFGRLKKAIWSKRSIGLQLKSRLYRAFILPTATWTLKSEDVRKLEVFERRCLRAISGIICLRKVKNEQVYKRLCMENTIMDVI